MRAALNCVDIVGEREQVLTVRVVVLQGHLNSESGRIILSTEKSRFLVEYRFAPVEVLYERV